MHKGKTHTSARKDNFKMDFPIFKTAKLELHDRLCKHHLMIDALRNFKEECLSEVKD